MARGSRTPCSRPTGKFRRRAQTLWPSRWRHCQAVGGLRAPGGQEGRPGHFVLWEPVRVAGRARQEVRLVIARVVVGDVAPVDLDSLRRLLVIRLDARIDADDP